MNIRNDYSASAVKHAFWFMEFRKTVQLLSEGKSFADIKKLNEEAFKKAQAENRMVIVLAGRPYHLDGEINHGIPELITSYGFAVLTEDSISHLASPERPLIVSDQWMYHSRLYAAAQFIKTQPNLEIIQLNS